MEKIRIRDKHPRSATLLTLFNLVDDCVDGLQGLEPWTKYIYKDTKHFFLKIDVYKYLAQVFICLRPPPLL